MRRLILLVLFLTSGLTLSDVFDDEAYVTEEFDYAEPTRCEQYCRDGLREKRLSGTPGKSRVIDAMMNTPMLNLNAAEPDILSILRDQYELPKGTVY